MTDREQRIADAVLAVPGVVSLMRGAPADEAGPDRVCAELETSVHVSIDSDAAVRATAERVQDVTHQVTGGPVNVTIEEVLP